MVKRIVLIVAAVVGVLGCRGPGQVVPEPKQEAVVAAFEAAAYERIPQEAGRVFWVDNDDSTVRFYLWRGGPLAAKGHNHVMLVKNIDGAVFLPADLLKDRMRFDLVFPADDIEVDPPWLREALGGAFATEISPEGMEGTRDHMLGENVLDAQRFPAVGLSGDKIYGEPPKLVLDTVVTLHGLRRHRLVPATVIVEGDRLSVRGSFAIEQTDFGIEPFSTMGGALYVQDPIMIEFEIGARTR